MLVHWLRGRSLSPWAGATVCALVCNFFFFPVLAGVSVGVAFSVAAPAGGAEGVRAQV